MRVVVIVLAFLLCACAAFEPTVMGNEAGGVVKRDRGVAEEALLAAADTYCGQFNKVARISGRNADSLTFDCLSLGDPLQPAR